METTETDDWKKTACIICSLNCGLDIKTDGKRITKIRGDKSHPISQGYICEKSQRMDFYQNGADRIDSPKRRKPDGNYENIDWDTAIREIAEKFTAIKQRHGGDSILYYGGGSQGNHLGGTYADSTIKALGIAYRSNALAQEKTGEGWVQGKMAGAPVHGDFEHCEVAVFLGKNPWQSHGFARTRATLRDIQNDPNRAMIVIDPRRTETAKMANYHLAVKPGTDAWCLTALSAILVQEKLVASAWLAQHTTGYEAVEAAMKKIHIARYATVCGVEESLLRSAARRIASANSVAMIEDLGVQMNVHSTLNSYLNRLVWLLTGNYAKTGANNAFVPLLNLSNSSRSASKIPGNAKSAAPRKWTHSPVTNSKVIMGLIPCNVIPDEILTQHPKRFRAMFIESANPVHSLADSQRMRQALRALECSVVIDVAMTETARQADYVLPASSQFEKAEATFFNLEFPRNGFQLRHPHLAPRPGTLAEAEIHARLLEAMGELNGANYTFLRAAARMGYTAFGLAFAWKSMRDKKVARYAPVVLYRTLGPSLPAHLDPAASLWGICQLYVRAQPAAATGAGFGGPALLGGNRLFDAILQSPSGVIFAVSKYSDSWDAVKLPDHKINLNIKEMLDELVTIDNKLPPHRPNYPFILSAGERRSETSQTSIRNPEWMKKGSFGVLRIHPQDAATLGCAEGDWIQLCTPRGTAQAPIELTDELQPGHVSLPNGHGLDYTRADGTLDRRGVSLNELTNTTDRDPFAGTPWHKYVPVRLERLTPA
ncbi:MAG: molybdopterin-dependent oxidoreductase [Rhodoferax sp.]|jgi:anaerobic selenocysteine-containing dehydrogenase|nr:molybdopterin-dependent oxidoreductase [Rhodoferax sp.]